VGRDLSKPAWGAVFRQMMGRDLVRPDPDRHGALRMTDAARPILRGEASSPCAATRCNGGGDREPVVRRRSRTRMRRFCRAEGQAPRAGRGAGRARLCRLSRPHPDRDGRAPPATLDQMARITGVGAKKLESYGAAFLEVITGAAETLHPARMRLAGAPEGAVFDRLAEVQLALAGVRMGRQIPLLHATPPCARLPNGGPRP
jgi:ATP-dependent DNA helicase RecQ